MIKVTVTRNNGAIYGAQFPTQQEADAWVQQESQNGSWGKAEHEVWNPETEENELVEAEFVVEMVDISSQIAAENARAMLQSARAFGNKVIEDFTLENMMMGITQDGMTGTVRKALAEVMSALETGSLYDAIDEIKAIPAEDKDPKYITDARLLAAVNGIEAKLGLPASEDLE